MKPYCKLAQYQLAVQPVQPSGWWSWWQGTLSAPSQLWRFCHSVSQNCKPAKTEHSLLDAVSTWHGTKPSPSLSHFFPPHEHAGLSQHKYLWNYTATRIGEQIQVKNNSAKEKVILTSASQEAMMPRGLGGWLEAVVSRDKEELMVEMWAGGQQPGTQLPWQSWRPCETTTTAWRWPNISACQQNKEEFPSRSTPFLPLQIVKLETSNSWWDPMLSHFWAALQHWQLCKT